MRLYKIPKITSKNLDSCMYKVNANINMILDNIKECEEKKNKLEYEQYMNSTAEVINSGKYKSLMQYQRHMKSLENAISTINNKIIHLNSDLEKMTTIKNNLTLTNWR